MLKGLSHIYGSQYFPLDMPVRQGPRWMPARCIHGDAGDNTDDPGAMVRDGPWCDTWMCESPLSSRPLAREVTPKYPYVLCIMQWDEKELDTRFTPNVYFWIPNSGILAKALLSSENNYLPQPSGGGQTSWSGSPALLGAWNRWRPLWAAGR